MKFKFLYFLPLAILGIACDDSGNTSSNERIINVDAFHAVAVYGNAVVRFDPALNSGETVIVKGNPADVGDVSVRVTNGTLVIRSSNNVLLNDSLTIIANPPSLTGITLEADQQAAIYWDGDHNYLLGNLDIKTEANSMLGLFNIRAQNINIQQEAQSKVQVESWFRQDIDTLAVLKSTAILIEPDSYLIDDAYIITFDAVREVEVDGQAYVVFDGPGIRRFFIVPDMTAKLEATSTLLAGDLPIRNLDITLEGESTATAWVINSLSGSGKGKSTLIYKGTPAIEYTTEGEASIEKN